MKRFLVILLALFTLSLCACSSDNLTNDIPPVVEILPTPDLPETETEIEDEEEEKGKKRYAVSTVNSLRIRTSPNTASTVLGYLDKNDAVLIVGEDGKYYKTVFKDKGAYISKGYVSVMEIEEENEGVEKTIDEGSKLLGYPYVWGSQRYHWGNGKLNKDYKHGEYDCSALVQYVYYKAEGIKLDLTSRTQVNNGKEVKKEDLRRGDLMFFTNASRKDKTGTERIGHVGIYFGNGYILHTASDHAVIEPISATRWSYYITARRVV